MKNWVRWWLFGAFAGSGLLFATTRFYPVFPLVIAVLVVLVIRSPERAAFGGGAMIPTGAWFLFSCATRGQRCAETGPKPSGDRCEIYGVEEQAVAMGLYVAVGLGLTAYAVLRPRFLSRA